MNILYIGDAGGFRNAEKFYMIPQKLINGFTRQGHNVYAFNDRDYARACNPFGSSKLGEKKLNAKAIEVARHFAPGLIVLGHCKLITNDTLGEIRAALPGVKIVYRNVDPLQTASNISDIQNRVGAVDGIFITTAGEALKQFAHPDSFVCYMPNPIDASIETARAFEQDGATDVFFAGGALRHQADQRREILDTLQKQLPTLRLGFHEQIFGHDYLRLLADSRIGLNLNKTDDYYLYASDRMAQYLGNGLLVCTAKKSGFQDLFSDDEMIFFADTAELLDKIRFYAAHDDRRREAARRGWEKAHRLFDTRRIAQFIVEKTFGQNLSLDYGWPTESY